MRRDEALSILTAHKDDLARFHVKSLALFGSVARDEAQTGSDSTFSSSTTRMVAFRSSISRASSKSWRKKLACRST